MAVARVVVRMHAACGAVRLCQGRAGLRQRAALVAPKRLTGDQSGIGAGNAGACGANGPVPCTMRPPTTVSMLVMSGMSSSATVK